MLLVLFSVLLILPAFQVEGQRYQMGTGRDPCYPLLVGAANIFCKLKGHNGFKPSYEKPCNFKCYGEEVYSVPEDVCQNGRLPCNDDVKAKLQEWKEAMEKKRQLICE
uniref:Putative ixodes 10 kDa peptide protein n=1 Tax=Ixodes ricinus TaxID=34613 RepID=A0A0K8RIW2_IXORI